MYFKVLEKQKQAKPHNSGRKEVTKIRVEINKMETKRVIQRINETKSWFFARINTIDKPLAKLTKINKQKTQ
jgi:hemerythrin